MRTNLEVLSSVVGSFAERLPYPEEYSQAIEAMQVVLKTLPTSDDRFMAALLLLDAQITAHANAKKGEV